MENNIKMGKNSRTESLITWITYNITGRTSCPKKLHIYMPMVLGRERVTRSKLFLPPPGAIGQRLGHSQLGFQAA